MMPIRTTICLILLSLIFATSVASADRKTYIIHIDNSNFIHQNPQNWYQTILNSIHEDEDEDSLPPELLYTYDTTMTGFAAKLTAKQHISIAKTNGVLFTLEDEILSLHTTYSTHFLGLEPKKGLWNSTSLSTDVIVGVLDTGIWPEHISFNDFGLSHIPQKWKGSCEKGTNFSASNCNRKLIGAKALFKGYEAINGRVNETSDYRSARDSNGHGTHTASTAAGAIVPGASLFGMAKGAARGMRYTSRIAAYKVCWQGGCASSDILAAIDQAVSDGVDILSLSLGGLPRPYYLDSMAIAAFGATQKGVFMSCSAGNSGPTPSTVGNMAPWITTVGASYTDRVFPTKIRLSNGKTFEGASLYSAKRKKTKDLPIVYKDTAGINRAEFCVTGSLTPSLVKGKIVICERGLNGRTEKGFIVKSAGGAGMLLLNSPSQGEELFADPHVLPAATLGASAAKAIKEYLSVSKNLSGTITFLGTRLGARAPVVAAFSSRGPSFVDPYVIKPDVTTPGVNILAAWPPNVAPTELKSDKRRVLFNIISGTSMSCPHLSGIAALIKSVHKDWSPAAIKSAILTTSYTHDNRGHLISDTFVSKATKFATPFAFGSGHADPEKASDPGLVYDISGEDYLQYLCSINYTNSQVTLLARRNYTCPSSSLKPGDLNYPSFSVMFAGAKKGVSTVTYKRTVKNVGSIGKITYRVFVEKPKGIKVIVEPSVLDFKVLGEKKTYKVTFSGSSEKITTRGTSLFGSLVWIGGKFRVRSPIAVTWQ